MQAARTMHSFSSHATAARAPCLNPGRLINAVISTHHPVRHLHGGLRKGYRRFFSRLNSALMTCTLCEFYSCTPANCHRNPQFLSGSQAVDLQDNSQPSFLSFFGPLPRTLTLSPSAALAITPLLLPPRGRWPRYCRHRDSLHHSCRFLLTSSLSPHSLRLI